MEEKNTEQFSTAGVLLCAPDKKHNTDKENKQRKERMTNVIFLIP